MRWFPPDSDRQDGIKNTTGAGDTFRGALLFGLIQPPHSKEQDHLAHCVKFAVRCATQGCHYYEMKEALDKFRENGFALWQAVDEWDQAAA